MADVRISNLAAAVAANLDGNSLIPVTDSEGTITTVKVTMAQMRTSLLSRAVGNFAATDYLSLGGASPPSTGWIRVDGTTVTSSTPILNAIQTWNQGATVFTGLLLNITNTSSSASSLLVDLQVATISKFKVDVSGNVTTTGNLNTQAITATTGLFTGSLAVTSTSAGVATATFNGQYAVSGTVDLSIWNRNTNAVSMRLRYDDAATNMRFGTASAHDWIVERGGTTQATIGALTWAFNSVALSGITTLAATGDVTFSATKKVFLDGGGDTYIQENSANRLGLFVGGAHTVDVSSTGVALAGVLESAADANSAAYVIRTHDTYASAGTNETWRILRNNSEVGSVTTTLTVTAYNTSSDERLKDLRDLSSAAIGSILDGITVYDGAFKKEPTLRSPMFSAQQLYQHAPWSVKVGGDDPETDPWSVDHSKLVPLLTAEVKSLRARVADVEARLGGATKTITVS